MNQPVSNWSRWRALLLIAVGGLALSVASCASGACVCPITGSLKGAALHEVPIPLASGAQPVALAGGSDHNVWFTACQVILGGTNKLNGWIGRLTLPADTITLYPLQAGGTQRCPAEITAGPDGNLWFNEKTFAGQGFIGRVSTSGVITEFALPTMQYLNGIATGADGDIWISGTPIAGNFAIAAVSPSTGTIVKSASIPNAQGNPEDLISNPIDNSIVAAGYNQTGLSDIYSVNTSGIPTATIVATQGADKAAFWVMLAYGANTIFVPNTIAPSGGSWSTLTLSASGYTQNVVPGIPGNNVVQGIAFGPDGNLYLANNGQSPNSGSIYVVSANGAAIRNISFSSPGVYPFQSVVGFGNPMLAGPDGNMYFAESNNQKIGEIVLH